MRLQGEAGQTVTEYLMILGFITSVALFMVTTAERPFRGMMRDLLQCVADGTTNQMRCNQTTSSGVGASGGAGLSSAINSLAPLTNLLQTIMQTIDHTTSQMIRNLGGSGSSGGSGSGGAGASASNATASSNTAANQPVFSSGRFHVGNERFSPGRGGGNLATTGNQHGVTFTVTQEQVDRAQAESGGMLYINFEASGVDQGLGTQVSVKGLFLGAVKNGPASLPVDTRWLGAGQHTLVFQAGRDLTGNTDDFEIDRLSVDFRPQ